MVPVLGKKLFLLLLPLQEVLRKRFHIYPKHFVRYEQLIISNGSDITAKRIMGCCLPLPLALTPWCIQTQSRNASACMASLFTLGLQSTFFKPSTALASGTCTGNHLLSKHLLLRGCYGNTRFFSGSEKRRIFFFFIPEVTEDKEIFSGSVDARIFSVFFCLFIFKLMFLIFQTKPIYNLFNFFIINNKTKYSPVYLL